MLPTFKSIKELLKAFPTEQSCIDHLEKLIWNGVPISPFDQTAKVYKCAGNKYKCKATGKYFNIKTKTIFDNSKIKLQDWFLALFLFSSHKKGISSHQLARDINVTQKTAWFMLARLRYAFDHPAFNNTLGTITEIDETFCGGKAKNKHENKKNKSGFGGSRHKNQPVIGMKERGGNVIAIVIPDRSKETILPLINKIVDQDSIIITDEYTAYNDLKITHNHLKVHHGAKEYVNGMAHTNGIENFWSHLKRGIDGIYHWCSVGHLQSYVDEFTLRFNTRSMATQGRFDFILSALAGKHLTYKNLTTHE